MTMLVILVIPIRRGVIDRLPRHFGYLRNRCPGYVQFVLEIRPNLPDLLYQFLDSFPQSMLVQSSKEGQHLVIRVFNVIHAHSKLVIPLGIVKILFAKVIVVIIVLVHRLPRRQLGHGALPQRIVGRPAPHLFARLELLDCDKGQCHGMLAPISDRTRAVPL